MASRKKKTNTHCLCNLSAHCFIYQALVLLILLVCTISLIENALNYNTKLGENQLSINCSNEENTPCQEINGIEHGIEELQPLVIQ